MEGLIHWDFSPGLALEAQVRAKFGSTVHFSPSNGSKEFFLVVAFSSASFKLTEESVGLALQCCIGGNHQGFRVFQLSDHRFQFSVASNRVGHFIYGLKDRIWPDFICHFSLFRGVHPSVSGFISDKFKFSASDEVVAISCRSPLNIRPNLKFLEESSQRDHSNSSASVLANFGFTNSDSPQVAVDSSLSGLVFGSIHVNLSGDDKSLEGAHFLGANFDTIEYYNSLPIDILPHILDLRQATYSDAHIARSLNIRLVPPSEYIFKRLNRCARCSVLGHLAHNCPGIRCLSCHQRGRSCKACVEQANAKPKKRNGTLQWAVVTCATCQEKGHSARNCLIQKTWKQNAAFSDIDGGNKQLKEISHNISDSVSHKRKGSLLGRKVWVIKRKSVADATNPSAASNNIEDVSSSEPGLTFSPDHVLTEDMSVNLAEDYCAEGIVSAMSAYTSVRLQQMFSVMHSMHTPSIAQDNQYFCSFFVQCDPVLWFEMFGEFGQLLRNRRNGNRHSVSSVVITELDDSADTTGMQIIQSTVLSANKSKCETEVVDSGSSSSDDSNKVVANVLDNFIPINNNAFINIEPNDLESVTVTTQVRRSTRYNKYDGFKVDVVTDKKKTKTKVKPRKVPRILDVATRSGEEEAVPVPSIMDEPVVPPPTPVPVLQSIGIQLCGVPAEQLSPKKLLANLQED